MYRNLLLIGCCLFLLLPACQGAGDGRLTVVFPLETTELAGGQLLRMTVSLADLEDQPVENATVQAELRAPDGKVLTTVTCAPQGQGRYLADYVELPLRGAAGTWRVVARATWGDGKQAQAEREFKGLPSQGEKFQDRYGFWIAASEWVCPNKTTAHQFRDWVYDDGSGFVLLEFHCLGTGHDLVDLDVHWQHADLPADEAAAIAHAQALPPPVYHPPGVPNTDMAAERTTFQGRPAWRVTGHWQSIIRSDEPQGSKFPIEWVILNCPDSEWLWSLVISTNEPSYMDYLRSLRETFECPAPK